MDERLEIKQRLKDDLPHYASKCLKIRSKEGSIEPFVLNKGQLHIHNQLEKQLKETGKVRALILKGRQLGCCLSPDSLVLTSDYKWIKLDDIQLGQKIVACDEQSVGTTNIGRKQSRKFRTAIVEIKREFYKQAYEILLDNGTKLIATSDHKMLSKQRGGDYQQWRYIEDFQVGDAMRVITRTPNYKSDYEDGWVGGLIDGEGSWRAGKGAKRLSISQVDGAVLQRLKSYLNNIDMPYCEVIDHRKYSDGNTSKLGEKAVHRIDIHRLPYIIEILARCRPSRFVDRDWHSGHELPGKAATDGIKPWAKVVSIKPLGVQRVIDLQTSEKTFIVNGLVSHNSTYIGARYYHKVTHSFGVQAFILTHSLEATGNLYTMAKRFYEHTPVPVKPQVSKTNAKELVFGLLESGYKLGTAENKNVGRSSTIQLLHWSETAFSSNTEDHSVGIMQAVPNASGTEVILESTANGVGNYFHQEWQKAEAGISDFIAIFVPWFWQDEYAEAVDDNFRLTPAEAELQDLYRLTNEQLNWRRKKIIQLSVNGVDGEKSFKQEYPNTSQEAFQLTGENSYIDSSLVMRARKCQDTERYGPLLLGVDPARFGDDRTAIIRRQGRTAFGLEKYIKKDTMEVVGIVYSIYLAEKPAKIFVDVGGLGAGVVDRLKELIPGDIVVGVNAGSTPLEAKRFKNKRAELWALCKEWLNDEPCSVPDDDELHSDLCSIKYKVDSNSRLVMESKEDMKKRGIRSSDTADALNLTFSLPDSAYVTSGQNDILDSMLNSYIHKEQVMQRSRR